MRNFIFVMVVVLVSTSTGFGQRANTSKVDPGKAVREVFDRLIDGIKQVDADKVMSTYENSGRLLIFNNNGTATNGWDNVMSNLTQSYPKISNVTLEITGLRVEMMGTTAAYVSCKWKQTQESDGVFESASGRMTLVFRLIGKQWKIVHRHTSPDNPPPTRPVFPSERQE